MMITAGKIIVRAWPKGMQAADTGIAAIVGIVEACDFRDEVIYDVILEPTTPGAFILHLTGETRSPDSYPASDMGHILTSSQWSRPNPAIGLEGGGILLRRTRIPAATGTTCIIAGLFSTNTLEDQTLFDVRVADDALVLDNLQCAKHLQTNGRSLDQILKLPIWGNGPDPWGLCSTLRLDVIDACHRYMELEEGAAEAYPGECKSQWQKIAAGVMSSGKSDDDYQRFRAEFTKRYGIQRWDGCETAADKALSQKRVKDLICELMPVG